ncbi:cell shape determination protein CcmA [Azoarcus sp. DD4]|uniref:bactofilin family protein n=1 Tax=Azoarcus sp. DD4 TaxID=2027405 RepID=UPI00112ABDD3|nr:polymer-forming cytoskeletal protein [Azoarcus sp. DD4]QDF98192.1 cell shape determination protein CcmA [Azoarcus sp. DD4]
MFNKPALFPKNADTLQSRTVRPVGSGVTANGNGSPQTPTTPALSPQKDSPPVTAPLAQAEAATPLQEEASSRGSSLIVGPDVKLKGAEILDCDTLVVEGRVEATMDSRVIKIAENGAFSGTVCIDVAEIHGNFDGELTAREQLIIHATGRVSGKIRYGKILIEAGGEVSGDVQSFSAKKGGLVREEKPALGEPKPLAAVAG